jgi:transposase-like protein
MPPLVDEIFPVVFADGIYLARNVVVLIARSEQHVLGWYVARSENSSSWEALLSRIAAPDMVVTDGGSGFEKARRRIWNQTRVQRCTFHAFCQVKRYTTSRPKLPVGAELFGIACDLLHVKDTNQAASWLVRYSSWCTRWEGFLAEESLSEGRLVLTHERLVKARNGLTRLVRQDVLLTQSWRLTGCCR